MGSLIFKILKFLTPVIVIWIMSAAFGWIGGLIGFVACALVIAYTGRATFMFLAGSFKFNDNNELGLKLMEKAYKTGRLSAERALTFAFLVLRDGQVERAENLINKITYLKKNEIKKDYLMLAKVHNALILWKQGNLSDAIIALEELYDNGYKSTTFYGTLGYFYILDGQLTKALQFNLEAYEYNSTNFIIQDNLASNYLALAEYDKAQELYDKLLSQAPKFIEPYYNYAKLMEIRGNKSDAIEYYKKALEFEEKFLSTVTHEGIQAELDALLNSNDTEME